MITPYSESNLNKCIYFSNPEVFPYLEIYQACLIYACNIQHMCLHSIVCMLSSVFQLWKCIIRVNFFCTIACYRGKFVCNTIEAIKIYVIKMLIFLDKYLWVTARVSAVVSLMLCCWDLRVHAHNQRRIYGILGSHSGKEILEEHFKQQRKGIKIILSKQSRSNILFRLRWWQEYVDFLHIGRILLECGQSLHAGTLGRKMHYINYRDKHH